MSPTLDLAGATTVMAEDSTATYYRVTDSVGGGSLVLSAGSSLIFDDSAGAGFVYGEGFSVIVNGTASSHCVIKSASDTPSHGWNVPATSINISATRCDLYSYSGNLGNALTSNWTFTNCNFFPFELQVEPRTLIADLLTAQWSLTTVPEIRDDDARREPQGLVPLIKVYPLTSPSRFVGRAEAQRIEHHLTISIRCRDRSNAFRAKEEVCRILDLYLDHPWTGYDLMTHQDGAYRGGNQWLYQWDVEVVLYQLRKEVVRR